MRLSASQKAVLITLYAIAERQGESRPVPLMALFRAVNSEREVNCERPIADRNFRTSCHTLAKHGLVQKFRDTQSLHLLFSLSASGTEIARSLYQQYLAEHGER